MSIRRRGRRRRRKQKRGEQREEGGASAHDAYPICDEKEKLSTQFTIIIIDSKSLNQTSKVTRFEIHTPTLISVLFM